MKKVAKIFIIIGMICGFWCILPLIFGFRTLKRINANTLTTGDKVLTLIFVNTIGGILLLCDKS